MYATLGICHSVWMTGMQGTLHQWRTQEFYSGRGSTNSVEDRGQRERGSGGSGSPSQEFWRKL
jgi:hypothetical protein